MRKPGSHSTSPIPNLTHLPPAHKRYTEVLQPKPNKGAIRLPQVSGITDPHYPPMVNKLTPAAEEETGHCGGTKLQAFTTVTDLVQPIYLLGGHRLTTTIT